MQDLVCQICVTIADKGAAEFAVGSLIVDLINSDGNWEAIMIGLKALLSIYMAAPGRAAGKSHPLAQVYVLHISLATCSCLCLLLCMVVRATIWCWDCWSAARFDVRQCMKHPAPVCKQWCVCILPFTAAASQVGGSSAGNN